MAQQNYKNPISSAFVPQKGFGFHQYINFGKKHKSKTFYDVATSGDFGYLRWCLNYDPYDRKTKTMSTFFISEPCFAHIRAALQTEHSKEPWKPIYSPPDETGKMNLKYVSKNAEGEVIAGPDIEMKQCPGCGRIKNYFLFDVADHDICRVCFFQKQQESKRYNNAVENHQPAVEDKKGWEHGVYIGNGKFSYANTSKEEVAAKPNYGKFYFQEPGSK
jgi:hypothetical protein